MNRHSFFAINLLCLILVTFPTASWASSSQSSDADPGDNRARDRRRNWSEMDEDERLTRGMEKIKEKMAEHKFHCDKGTRSTEFQPNLDQFIRATMACLRVPAVVMSMVRNGTTRTFTYGKRSPTQDFNPDTLVGIGSTSKAFTTTLVAKLVSQNLLDFDEPIQSYLPSLQFIDPIRTQTLTIRDLLAMRTGLARHDVLWVADVSNAQPNNFDQTLDKVPYLQPILIDYSTGRRMPNRYAFSYNNLMYNVIGKIIEQRANMSFVEYLQQTILTPLGMTSTQTSHRTASETPNFGHPQRFDARSQAYIKMPFEIEFGLDTILPAGGIVSTANDMAKWLGYLTSVDYQNAFLPLLETWLPSMAVRGYRFVNPLSGFALGFTSDSYGMGWFSGTLSNEPMIWHGGNTLGASSMVTVLPNAGSGVFINTNSIGPINVTIAHILVSVFALNEGLEDNPADIRAFCPNIFEAYEKRKKGRIPRRSRSDDGGKGRWRGRRRKRRPRPPTTSQAPIPIPHLPVFVEPTLRSVDLSGASNLTYYNGAFGNLTVSIVSPQETYLVYLSMVGQWIPVPNNPNQFLLQLFGFWDYITAPIPIFVAERQGSTIVSFYFLIEPAALPLFRLVV